MGSLTVVLMGYKPGGTLEVGSHCRQSSDLVDKATGLRERVKLASAPSSLVLSCLVSIVRAPRVGGREGVKPTQSSQDWEPPAGPQDSKVCYSRGSFSRSPFLKWLEREGGPAAPCKQNSEMERPHSFLCRVQLCSPFGTLRGWGQPRLKPSGCRRPLFALIEMQREN